MNAKDAVKAVRDAFPPQGDVQLSTTFTCSAKESKDWIWTPMMVDALGKMLQTQYFHDELVIRIDDDNVRSYILQEPNDKYMFKIFAKSDAKKNATLIAPSRDLAIDVEPLFPALKGKFQPASSTSRPSFSPEEETVPEVIPAPVTEVIPAPATEVIPAPAMPAMSAFQSSDRKLAFPSVKSRVAELEKQVVPGVTEASLGMSSTLPTSLTKSETAVVPGVSKKKAGTYRKRARKNKTRRSNKK